jgi:SlyX protein
MNAPSLEDRITDLEIKLTYQDDLLRTLNDVIVELRGHVEALSERVESLESELAGEDDRPTRADEPPPHY